MKKNLLYFLLPIMLGISLHGFTQTTVKKVILQAFWWDYWNTNYPNSWANYLTELAPRLKGLGIDAVWIPPTSKGGSGTNDVGYGTFDHYDLGDKFQKNNVRTRIGSKDELLRMFAVMHANGIEVMQDIVPNQLGGAGDLSTGGIDPAAVTNNKYKNFRYVDYNSPAKTLATATDSANEYLARTGRFSKNWQNFHNNPAHNGCETNSGDNWCYELFGPDICYYDNAFGQSNNATYNPTQVGGTNNGYMRRGYRDWLMWLKKQTGFDGIRLDAAKHYEYAASEDWLYNLQNSVGFANGTDSMLAVGEYVGSATDEDTWCNNVSNRSGTFDFNFRSAIKNMVDGNGSFNMASLPSAQQNNRIQNYTIGGVNTYVNRTIPFVNNHDTFRPIYDANGNYIGWNTSNELGGGHIDPFNNMMPLAYATMMAMDGNPQLFIEDLFNLGGTSKRFSHIPSNTTDLPLRAPLDNIIWCHQNLKFKNGAYKIRSTTSGGNVYFPSGSSDADLLIIERSNKAIIGLNDNNSAWQSAWVDADFPSGTVLKDYSGANGTATFTVDNSKRVLVNVPPVQPANNLYGYAIWAPVGITSNYTPSRNNQTTQEWEMANDLGDSHCSSLMQGGALPSNTTNQRVVGKIFVAAGTTVTYKITPEVDGNSITATLWNVAGTVLSTTIGVANIAAPLIGNYTATTDGWLVIKVRNSIVNQAGQKLWVNVSYTAPQVVNTLATANAVTNSIAIWTGNKNTTDITDCGNWEEGKMPSATTNVLIPAYATPFPVVNTNLSVNNITIENGATIDVNTGIYLLVFGDWNNLNSGILPVCGTVNFVGSTLQNLNGRNQFCRLVINNANNVNATNDNYVYELFKMLHGNYLINNHYLYLKRLCGVSAPNDTYVQFPNDATSGYIQQALIPGQSIYFPIGNSNFTPVTIVNTGTEQYTNVRCFENVLKNGTSGIPMASTEKVLKTWEVTPLGTGVVADLTFDWNASNHDVLFNTATCFIAKNIGGAGQNWVQIPTQNALVGSDPYEKTATAISTFSKFTLFSNLTALPIKIISFKAIETNKNAILNWTVSQQVDVEKYEIEKSIDGINFIKIGEAYVLQQTNYQFTDIAFTQNAYYRIVVVPINNMAKSYSGVSYLQKNGIKKLLTISPNPISNYCIIYSEGISDNENLTARIVNVSGVSKASFSGNFATLKPVLTKQINQLNSGIYYLQITSSSNNYILKIIKQ